MFILARGARQNFKNPSYPQLWFLTALGLLAFLLALPWAPCQSITLPYVRVSENATAWIDVKFFANLFLTVHGTASDSRLPTLDIQLPLLTRWSVPLS